MRCARGPAGILRKTAAALTLAAGVVAGMLGRVPPAAATAAAPATGRPWLFVSDVHLDVAAAGPRPRIRGVDTNRALLASFLDAAKRVDPDPPVVVLAGDFVAHDQHGPAALATMLELARRFDRVFPNAQFVFTLGNNDSPCGDYAAPAGNAFLRAVARAWKPLVDRHGAAPDFETTFARDGSYVARLPVPGLRAVVLDDVFFALRFNPTCGARSAPGQAFGELSRALAAGGPSGHAWVVLHVPPGIDAYSTAHLAHHLVVVPFVRPRARDALLATLGAPAAHVALVVAGHTHKFAFRIVPGGAAGDGVPMLLIPSVSPIFGNRPGFLTARVGARGTLADVVEYGFDGASWARRGALADLGVRAFTPDALRGLQQRIERDPAVRARFSALYGVGGPPEYDGPDWRTYWCASTEFTDTAFERCSGHRGFAFVTRRGELVLGAALLGAVAVAVAVAILVVRSRRGRRRPRGSRPSGAPRR